MNPQQRKEASRYLSAFDFSGLFTDPSIGWDWPDSGDRLRVPVPNGPIDLRVVAEKRGVKVLLVPPDANGSIMPSDERKKLEKAVTPLAAEHLLIFADKAKTRQVWLWTSRLPGKPVRHRELTWEKGRKNELLIQKLTSIAFSLDEEEALDITGVVHRQLRHQIPAPAETVSCLAFRKTAICPTSPRAVRWRGIWNHCESR